MNLYAAAMRTVGRTRAFAWLGSRLLHRGDLALRGRRRNVSTFGTGFPVLYLTARGCKSGEPRTVPLLFVRDGETLVVGGTNWGRKQPPAWVANLDAHPDAEAELDGVVHPVHARHADADERDRLWPQLVEVWPAYDDYARRAGREIVVYVLEPRREASRAAAR